MQRFHIFQDLPKHLRVQMTEDIILSIMENFKGELSQVPQKWKISRKNNNKSAIPIHDVQSQIKYDCEKTVENYLKHNKLKPKPPSRMSPGEDDHLKQEQYGPEEDQQR